MEQEVKNSNGQGRELSLVEVKEVVIAAKRLNELANRMRTETFGFKDKDVVHIDQIIDAIHELDLHRNRAMDVLETETIKCSAVRHKLMHYPDEINKEIHTAVRAARDLNEDEINELKSQLQQILDEIKRLETHAKELDADTEQLTPERNQIKLVFEEAVARLNERLADKAGEQIHLNENRDSVRIANVTIVDLEEDVVRLKEQMVVERQQHRETKKELSAETATTVEKFNQQKARNDTKRQDYAEASVKLQESSDELKRLQKQHESLTKKNSELENQEQELTQSIASQQQRNQMQRDDIERIRQLNRKMAEEHRKQMADMKRTVEQFNEKCKRQAKRKEKSQGQKEEIREVLDDALLVREQDAKKVRELNETLQEAKRDLATKAEDIGRLQQEIIDMENRRMELEDAHRSTVLTFNKQIAELKEQLSRERSERLTVQDSNDELQTTIEKFNKETNTYTRQMNKKITDLKHENVALNDEHNQLLKSISDDTSRRERLEAETESTRSELAESKRRREERLQWLRDDLQRLQEERNRRQLELDDLQPKFKEFVEFFDRTLVEYDALKKTIVQLKNRKTGLEESSRRTDQQIQQLSRDIQQLSSDKQKRRQQSSEQLLQLAQQRDSTERRIYALGCKLATVLRENARLRAGVNGLESEMRSMRTTWERSLRAKSQADQQRQRQQQRLREGWAADHEMQEEFFEEDQRLLAVLAAIIDDTDARKQLVEGVTQNLMEELRDLDSFLHTAEPEPSAAAAAALAANAANATLNDDSAMKLEEAEAE